MIRYTLLLALCAVECCSLAIAQQREPTSQSSFHQERLPISSKDTVIHLQHQFILPGTERIAFDSITLTNGKQYTLDERFGVLTLNNSFLSTLSQKIDSVHILTIRYQSLPFSFQESYRHRIPVVRIDTATGEKMTVSKPSNAFSFDDVFGSNLQKSGSIVRGLTIGSNRDLSLNSGFRMQMSGNITRDLEVIAALTDENSPIQPEGTTRTLQEVDKVFVQLRGNNLSATLGDFNLSMSGNEFGQLNRKLQGAQGVVSYRSADMNGDFSLTGASPRGKFTTNLFQGLDGVQGPYRLTGQNNERGIIIIAGTERVYVNGERMTRGDVNDYTIDYTIGEVTFTPKRLISRTSRITIDFEYTDRQFSRSLIAARSGTHFFNNRWSLNAMFIRESDDENSPIDISLSDSDKVLLQNAGGDKSKTIRSGIENVGVGKGQYTRIDTTVKTQRGTDTLISLYRYNPVDTLNAVYSITFSYVGAGSGDYNRLSSTQYFFAGLGGGSYAPIRYLPLPTALSLADFELGGELSDDLKISGEYAFSSFNINKFSVLDNSRSAGPALKLGLEFTPKNINVGGNNIGSLDMTLHERFIDHRFVPADRVNGVEFSRMWNISDSSNVDEEIREGTLSYKPTQPLTISGGFGWMKRGNPFTSKRYTTSMRMSGERFPQAEYDLEIIQSQNQFLDLGGSWTRHRGNTQYQLGKVTPTLGFNAEVLRNRGLALDTMKQGSFRFGEVIPGIMIDSLAGMMFHAQFGLRWDDSVAAGTFRRASQSFMQSYGWQLREWNSFSSSLDFTVQKKTFAEEFRLRNPDDINTILLRSQTRYTPINHGIESDLFYELATEKSAKLERVFQRVTKGSGNYIYAGDLNNNHIIDEQDFQLTRFDGDFIAVTVPTDALIPVIDLKTAMRLRFNGTKLFSADSWLPRTLSVLSSETYFRVEEKSTESDRKQIYFLHFDHFLNDQTTLAGTQLITQDVYVLENNTIFSLRSRYSQKNGLTQFALINERTYAREQSFRVRWQLIKEFSNQTDVLWKRDVLAPSQFNPRIHDIRSAAFSTDWTYRPIQQIEFGFKVSVGQSTNFDTTKADLNDQSARLVYSLNERGQARVQVSREEAILHRAGFLAPFELTGGRLQGRTFLWQLGLDYRVTQFMQGTVNYDGRSEGGGHSVHTARAEVRAFF